MGNLQCAEAAAEQISGRILESVLSGSAMLKTLASPKEIAAVESCANPV